MIKEKRMNNYKTWKKFCVKEKGFTLINRKIAKIKIPIRFNIFFTAYIWELFIQLENFRKNLSVIELK